ncbi:MAG: mechanosensitive ion channel [Methanomicrobiaceae archaeon]|nr:mechanosensitive ion channel [Methanomicrobiaceae archaeon]
MAVGLENITSIEDLPFREIDITTFLYIIYVFIVAYLIVLLSSYLLRKLAESAGIYRIRVAMVIPVIKILAYSSAMYLSFAAIVEAPDISILAFSGLFGAAIGFGLRDVFADLVGGLIISFERPYQIGDKITFGGYYGEVVDIGLRATRLVTPDDNMVSVPNYFVFTKSSASANAGKTEMMVVIDLFIDSRSDAGLAMSILKDAVITSKYVYISKDRPYTILLNDFPFYRRVRAKAYVNDLRSEFEFKSEVTRHAWTEYHRQGIMAPQFHGLIPEEVAMGPEEEAKEEEEENTGRPLI